MRVEWIEFCSIDVDMLEAHGWTGEPLPHAKYSGEVINAIRAFGETRLVVMLDSGEVKEVEISKVKRSEPLRYLDPALLEPPDIDKTGKAK